MLMEPTTKTDALRELRERAKLLFQKDGLPDKHHEEYKYCDITRYWNTDFAQQPDTHSSPQINIQSQLEKWHITPDDLLFVFVNGELISYPEQAILGIVFRQSDETPGEGESAPGTFAKPEDDPLLARHYSVLQKYFSLQVLPKTQVEQTLVFLHISDVTVPCGISMHKCFSVGSLAQVSVKQIYCSTGGSGHLVQSTDEWNLMPGASVHNLRIQEETPEAILLHHTCAHVQANASMNDYLITLSGKLVRNNTVFRLAGKNAQSHLYGLYLTGDQMLTDNHTLVDHRVSDCYSNELYKGILDGKSIAVFNGKIFVRKDAQKTNAYQSNKNILLSPQSTINTKPQLEIFADDVKCSHGTSTGRLDEAAMFYLKSRGIGEAWARKLLLMAFADDMADKIPSENDRLMLRGILENRLAQAPHV
jgi:Fe-S cluster assembly protein SufD